MAIDIDELMSPSEDEIEVDEWHPEKPEKGRRASKKAKTTGVRLGLGSAFNFKLVIETER